MAKPSSTHAGEIGTIEGRYWGISLLRLGGLSKANKGLEWIEWRSPPARTRARSGRIEGSLLANCDCINFVILGYWVVLPVRFCDLGTLSTLAYWGALGLLVTVLGAFLLRLVG